MAVTLEPQTAVFRGPESDGNYQALAVRASWSSTRYAASMYVPGYRLQAGDQVSYGPGDGMVDVAMTVLGGSQSPGAGGFALAGSVPLGDRARHFGMGHAMLMARAWASRSWRGIAGALRFGFGRALTSGGHHEHGSSLVNPMNVSEVDAGVGLAFPLTDRIRLTAAALGARPVSVPGTNRAAVSFGSDAQVDRWTWGLRLEAAILGSPQSLRLVAAVGVPL